MSDKVVVTSLLGDSGPHFEFLRNAGFEPVISNRKLNLNVEEQLIGALQDTVATIAGSENYTPRVPNCESSHAPAWASTQSTCRPATKPASSSQLHPA